MKKFLLPLFIALFGYQAVCTAQLNNSKTLSTGEHHIWAPVTLTRTESTLFPDSKGNTAKIAANTITTSSVTPFTYCKGASVTVPFTVSGTFNGDNVFTAQISDPAGTFTNPTTVGTLNGTSDGTISGTIPLTIANGGTYRIRVISSSPAINGSDNGTNLIINPLPTLYSITGNSSYCAEGNGVVIGLSNSEVGVKYQLKRDGANVGSEVNGNFLPLSFGSQKTVGTYTVIATYTATGCSQKMADSINLVINPLPQQFNVTGGGNYCAGGSGNLVGLSSSQQGISYQLLRYSTEVGSPISGNGDPISFGNQTVAGLYTIIAKNLQTGCSIEMSGNANVVVNPLPTQYDVVGGGSYCEGENGVAVLLYSSDTNVAYQLKVDGTNTGTPKNGTGLAIEFGLQKQPGIYTVEAINTKTSCKSTMTGSKTVTRNPIPSKPVITKSGNELTSSANTGNQWYLNQQLITNATAKTYSPTTSGKYSVVVTDKGCPSQMSDLIDVTINSDKLTAGFNADPTTGTAPLLVTFTDASTGKPKTWSWDFGDSQTSTIQNPTHTYTKAGSYTVTLIVSDGTTNDTKTKAAFIVVEEQSEVTANFSASVTGGNAPLVVKFTDLSTGAPTAWEWDFGDGSAFSTIKDPEHTYTTPGKFSVILTVTKDSKQYKTTKKDFITIESSTGTADENTIDATCNHLSLIPNPNDGVSSVHFYSSSAQKVTLTVTSILGEKILKKELDMQNGENNIPLDLTGLEIAEGMYYISVQHSGGTVSRIMQIVK